MKLLTYADPEGGPDRSGVLNPAGDVVDLGTVPVQELVAHWAEQRSRVATAAGAEGVPLGTLQPAPTDPTSQQRHVRGEELRRARP